MHSFLSTEALDKLYQPILQKMRIHKLVPVVRARRSEDALWAAEVLIEGGYLLIEVADTVPEADTVIRELVAKYPDVLVGAGTVMDKSAAQRLHQAGARFLVSPVLDESVLDFAQQEWVLAIPGAMTPTEVHRAHTLGAPVIKIFPAAHVGGPAYVQSLLDVMPGLNLMPTGGINNRNFWPYLEVGAIAVGLGQNLVNLETVGRRDKQDLFRRAKQYLSELSKVSSAS